MIDLKNIVINSVVGVDDDFWGACMFTRCPGRPALRSHGLRIGAGDLSSLHHPRRRKPPHVRSLRLPDHDALARPISRSPAALFAADAQWRKGIDHAGGDRPAL